MAYIDTSPAIKYMTDLFNDNDIESPLTGENLPIQCDLKFYGIPNTHINSNGDSVPIDDRENIVISFNIYDLDSREEFVDLDTGFTLEYKLLTHKLIANNFKFQLPDIKAVHAFLAKKFSKATLPEDDFLEVETEFNAYKFTYVGPASTTIDRAEDYDDPESSTRKENYLQSTGQVQFWYSQEVR